MNTADLNTWSWRCCIFQQFQSFALVPNRIVSLVAALGTHGQHGASVPAFEAANTGSCGGRNGGCRNHSRHRPHKFIPVKLEGERLNIYKYAEWLSPCKLASCRALFRLCCFSTSAETSPFSPQSQHFKHANILNRSQVVVEPKGSFLILVSSRFRLLRHLSWTILDMLLPFGRLHVVFNERRPDQKPIPSRYQQLPSLACTILKDLSNHFRSFCIERSQTTDHLLCSDLVSRAPFGQGNWKLEVAVIRALGLWVFILPVLAQKTAYPLLFLVLLVLNLQLS